MSALFLGFTDEHVIALKSGKVWQRRIDMSNPTNISACPCCMPLNSDGDELRLLIKRLPNDGKNSPTEEEWEEVRNQLFLHRR